MASFSIFAEAALLHFDELLMCFWFGFVSAKGAACCWNASFTTLCAHMAEKCDFIGCQNKTKGGKGKSRTRSDILSNTLSACCLPLAQLRHSILQSTVATMPKSRPIDFIGVPFHLIGLPRAIFYPPDLQSAAFAREGHRNKIFRFSTKSKKKEPADCKVTPTRRSN